MDPNITLSRLREVFTQWEEWGTLELDAAEAMDELVICFMVLTSI